MNFESPKLTSETLAALIADALVDGGLVKKESFEQALAIIREEIDARKALGDY